MAVSRYGPDDERKAIWVFLEREGDELAAISLELLGKGRQLANLAGWRLVGLLLGHHVTPLADSCVARGADEVLLVEHPLLGEFTVDAYSQAAFDALMTYKPSVFLVGATANGRDLAGRLAVRLRTGLNADCTDLRLEISNDVLICEVSGFGGGVLAMIEMREHRPQMATVRPGVFEAAEADYLRVGQINRLKVELAPEMIGTRVVERVVSESPDLSQVPVLVVGGRGVDGDFDMLRELAWLLDGDVGATRPPVDEGHIERERQIGQTGVVCRPEVAIVCGVSGAFHFVVGIEKADTVIAINSDPEAPIFEYADFCLVGDVHEIVPALIRALKEAKEAGLAPPIFLDDGAPLSSLEGSHA